MMSPGSGTARRPAPGGWHLLAFAGELAGPVTGLSLGSRALVAVRDQGTVRVFDGTCPHRGAHLGHGGTLVDGPGIICPFHGKCIGLGAGTGRLSVGEHEVIDGGGAVFVRLADLPARDRGFAPAAAAILRTHTLAAAVSGFVPVPPELVIENAFDFAHFPTVHLVSRLASPKVGFGDDGELSITTAFRTRAPAWETAEGDFTSRFHARAFNPHLVVTELGPAGASSFVFTGAVPAPGGCLARIAIAARRSAPAAAVTALADGARHAFEQDLRVWQHLDVSAPARLDARDAPVMAFRAFCASFVAAPARPDSAAQRASRSLELVADQP